MAPPPARASLIPKVIGGPERNSVLRQTFFPFQTLVILCRSTRRSVEGGAREVACDVIESSGTSIEGATEAWFGRVLHLGM